MHRKDKCLQSQKVLDDVEIGKHRALVKRYNGNGPLLRALNPRVLA